MSFFGGGGSSSSDVFAANGGSSTEQKNAVMKQVQEEAAMSNARALMSKMNENCFERCIPTPGSSLSSQESTCLSYCMEKYISVWNVTSRAYINRVSQESKRMGRDASALGAFTTSS